MADPFLYTGARTSQISFPLGGIGTGCIGLAGNGRLIDWEIFNRPNKGSVNGFSHFAVRAERDGQVIDARILHGDLPAPYQGELTGSRFNSFGWGPRREYLTGLPHFRRADFRGTFPIAELTFHDKRFPGQVTLEAFNPLIPLNPDDSGIPAAFFEFRLTNTTDAPLTYTLAGVLGNPLPANNLHRVEEAAWGHALRLGTDGIPANEIGYGDLTLATDGGSLPGASVSWQEYWFRGAWFDNLEVYWKDLNTPGAFKNRRYSPEKAAARNEGLLAVHVPVEPGATVRVRFVIAWNFPNCERYWEQRNLISYDDIGMGFDGVGEVDPYWHNYYATKWVDSAASAAYALANWTLLHEETVRFRDALFASTLPAPAIDAISANISILKSPTVLRLEDGTFYGWEGCHPSEGCCEGSCTHVWNYQQALPFLFPSLERSMREADYKFNLRADGGMPFRIQLPIGSGQWGFRPCADGQFGGVMKAYRDWKISGDDGWLRAIWPALKASINFAWHPHNEDRWDPEKSGVLTGRQHHTLDMELFGPNSWLTGFYLGALKAGAEMADALGDGAAADEYRAIFQRGKAWADEHLFNGEWYVQRIDLGDRSLVEAFVQAGDRLVQGGATLDAYWTEEHQEIKYQIGAGSSIDQILAQWHADLYGLGEIFDPAQVRAASAAIYRHNFIPEMGAVYNPCRIYCLNDEGGLVICAWPRGTHKPVIPAPYSQETMNGFEYAAASHMILLGLVDEGAECVAAIRRRYDGERRNPWNEFECGSNYARSMASYALLNAYSGFRFDSRAGMLGFAPVRAEGGHFRCFWSLNRGWGEFEMTPARVELRLLAGELSLARLELPFIADDGVTAVQVNGAAVPARFADGALHFADPLQLRAGDVVAVTRG